MVHPDRAALRCKARQKFSRWYAALLLVPPSRKRHTLRVPWTRVQPITTNYCVFRTNTAAQRGEFSLVVVPSRRTGKWWCLSKIRSINRQLSPASGRRCGLQGYETPPKGLLARCWVMDSLQGYETAPLLKSCLGGVPPSESYLAQSVSELV